MSRSNALQFLREPEFLDYDDSEAFNLEDLLYEVRALSAETDELPYSFASDYDVLIWALALICESPLGRTYAFDARFEDWAIELDDCEDGRFIADPQLRVLILPRFVPSPVALGRAPYFQQLFLVELIRGLRAIWQYSLGVRLGTELNIDDQIVWNRCVQADRDLSVLAVAWELREASQPDMWRHLIGSELGDLAISYSATLERHPLGLELGDLLRKLFMEWLEQDDLLNAVDHLTLERIDTVLHQSGSGQAFGVGKLTASDLYKLSNLPDEQMYLQRLAEHLVADPHLRRLPDQTNIQHLEHILEDLSARRMTAAGFRDQDLAKKIFPDLLASKGIDILS